MDQDPLKKIEVMMMEWKKTQKNHKPPCPVCEFMNNNPTQGFLEYSLDIQ